jgi:predicted ATPase/DNA-binding winged helix-turn-helix (wHTH) protein
MTGAATAQDFVFGRFVVQPGARRLLVDGEPARLGARAFDVLMALIERRERVVSKNELFERVWPGLVVEENNLQVHISSLRKILGPTVIATIPGRGYRFTAAPEDAALPAPEAAAAAGGRTRVGNLPEMLPTLYGRERDLPDLIALIEAQRLVTVVGAGGIGKTRLAQAAAHALRDAFTDGVWMVELAALADPALVPGVVAQALGITLAGNRPALDELVRALVPLQLLLVLDNCEHLLGACSAVALALLAHAPGVRLLATSQESFRLVDEQLVRLDTLAVPETASVQDAQHAGAVALFVARARAADPRFALSQANLSAVIEICRHLDGLALAIELAAARVPLLGIEGLRARLGDRFRLLTAGARFALRRHQTLRAALDWSHGLLTADEQTVFRRLGVFAGSFGLDSAQQVAADPAIDEWAALDHLGALVDKSLVVAEPGEEPRYRLLETGRAFALEKLQESGETEATLGRHARAVLAVFERSYEQQWSSPVRTRRTRYLPDLDNLRAASDWAARTPGESASLIALAGASAWIWVGAGLRPEGVAWCAQALGRVDETTPPALEARLQLGCAHLAFPRVTAVEMNAVQRAVALYRGLGDRRGLYLGLNLLAQRQAVMRRIPDAEQAIAEAASLAGADWPPALQWPLLMARAFVFGYSDRFEPACAIWEDLARQQEAVGERDGMLTSLMNGSHVGFMVDFDAAVRLLRRVVALMRAERNRGMTAGFARGNLCGALAQQGQQLDEALEMGREAAPLLIQSGALGTFLDHFALLAFRRGRAADAALVLGRAETSSAERGVTRDRHEQRSRDAALEGLQQSLPAGELERLLKEGAALGEADAARIALGEWA